MYDERQKGITYFIGYIRTGLKSNVRNNPDSDFWLNKVDDPVTDSQDDYTMYDDGNFEEMIINHSMH